MRPDTRLIFTKQDYEQVLFENAPIGIAVVGKDGTILNANLTLCEYLGYTKYELTRMNYEDITHPQDIDADNFEFELLTSGKIKQYSMKKRYIDRMNKVFWGELTVFGIFDKAGAIDEIIGFVYMLTDEYKKNVDSPINVQIDQNRKKVSLLQFVIKNWKWFAAGIIAALLKLDDLFDLLGFIE